MTQNSQISKVWTGGVVGSVAGKKFSLWFESEDKIKFSNFFSENDEAKHLTEDTNVIGMGNVFKKS